MVICLQTSPVAKLPSKLVVVGYKERKPTDQTSPVAKLPSKLVVGRPSALLTTPTCVR